MSNLLQMKLVLTACLGLLLAGVAYGQTASITQRFYRVTTAPAP